MDKNNFLKQYAINYLSKYDSTKMNLGYCNVYSVMVTME